MLNEQQREDLELISDPDSWPNIAILPVVNRRKPEGMFPKSGFLIEEEGSKVYLSLNIRLPLWGQLLGLSIEEYKAFKERLKTGVDIAEYKTYEEMLKDGWEVD